MKHFYVEYVCSATIDNYGINGGSIIRAAASPSTSPIWTSLDNYRGNIKRNSKGTQYYQWDYTHGDIEVYNNRGQHLGCIDARTGSWTKDAVKGRTIKL
jgi:hypothetical protein